MNPDMPDDMKDHALKVGNETFYRVDLAFGTGYSKDKLVVYTSKPQNIDYMINELVRFQAEKIAKQRLVELITSKVSKLLE